MKSFFLLIVSLVATLIIVELAIPEKYSSKEIYRTSLYKKRIGNRLDWINDKFRDRSAVDSGIIKGIDSCSDGSRRVLVIGDSFVYGNLFVASLVALAPALLLLAFRCTVRVTNKWRGEGANS